jgi:hypothetical protein
MELSYVTRLAIKGMFVHEALAKAPKYIKEHRTTKTKNKRQHKARKNHKKKKKTKHGKEDERREVTLKAIKDLLLRTKWAFKFWYWYKIAKCMLKM